MEILAIEGLTKNFYLHNLGKTIKSCRDIGFTLHEGEFTGNRYIPPAPAFADGGRRLQTHCVHGH